MSGFNDLTGIQIAIHRLAIDSVKISTAFLINLPLHGKNVILYAGYSLRKKSSIQKSLALFPQLIEPEKLSDMFFHQHHNLWLPFRFPVAEVDPHGNGQTKLGCHDLRIIFCQ